MSDGVPEVYCIVMYSIARDTNWQVKQYGAITVDKLVMRRSTVRFRQAAQSAEMARDQTFSLARGPSLTPFPKIKGVRQGVLGRRSSDAPIPSVAARAIADATCE